MKDEREREQEKELKVSQLNTQRGGGTWERWVRGKGGRKEGDKETETAT